MILDLASLLESMEHLSYPDFLTVVHEYWFPYDEDRQELEEAFDILDPKRTAKLQIEEFTTLLRNCDWSEEDIDLMMAQVNCGDGYFLYDGSILVQRCIYLQVSLFFRSGETFSNAG